MTAIIREASSAHDYEAFLQLINEYVCWLRARYEQDSWINANVLAKPLLTKKLEHLPSIYGASGGRAFVAAQGDEIRGCGAYRRLGDGICEMKRVFVPQRFQGAGLGRRICGAILDSARDDGFRLIRLDTGNLMKEAIALYQSLGFKQCAPYHEYPQRLMPYFMFMELPLADPATSAANRFADPGPNVTTTQRIKR